MNILFLTYQGDLGGATQSMAYLSEGLARRGHNVWFGCPADSMIYSMLHDSPVRTVAMEFSRYGGPAAGRIADLCRAENIQVVNPQSSQDRYAVMRARAFGGLRAAVVFTRRQMPDSHRLSLWLGNRFADRTIAVSRGVADALAARGADRNKLIVICNGTPREKYEGISREETDALRRELGIAPGTTVIGCLARRKRQDLLISAAPLLPGDAVVLIVGPGEQPGWRELVERLRPPQRIIMLPYRERALPFYGLMTVSVLPSMIEGLSQTILESMALGVPVVASRWGGNPEVVEHGRTGLLFEPLDHEDLARQVNRVLADRELARNFSERGRKRALEDFSIERTVEQTEECFERLIAD